MPKSCERMRSHRLIFSQTGRQPRRCANPVHTRASRPRERRREPGNRRRQLLRMSRGDVLQLACQHLVERRPLAPREVLKHLPLIPRHPSPQLDQPDRLRNTAGASSPSASSITACVQDCSASAIITSRATRCPSRVETATIDPFGISPSAPKLHPRQPRRVMSAKEGRGWCVWLMLWRRTCPPWWKISIYTAGRKRPRGG
jgi:hypothetical protein